MIMKKMFDKINLENELTEWHCLGWQMIFTGVQTNYNAIAKTHPEPEVDISLISALRQI